MRQRRALQQRFARGGGSRRWDRCGALTQARSIVSLDDWAAVRVLGADATVVRALRAIGEAPLWPAVRGDAVGLEERVLLLDAKPRLRVLDRLHDLVARDARVGRDRRAHAHRRVRVGLVAVAEDDDVLGRAGGAGAERVLVDRARHEEHLRVAARRLLGGGAIKIPHRQLGHAERRARESLGLATKLVVAADPDVFGHSLLALIERQKPLLDLKVQRRRLVIDKFDGAERCLRVVGDCAHCNATDGGSGRSGERAVGERLRTQEGAEHGSHRGG
jgi:hypothetical protein